MLCTILEKKKQIKIQSFLCNFFSQYCVAMAGRSMVFSSASNMDSATTYGPSVFMNGPSFHGSRSLFSFNDDRQEKSFLCSFKQGENVDDDDDFEEYLHQPEKKRRLSVEQVQFLEKSFDEENKLEPERKMQLAKELGLQPRQIAIWFQNRRARWKNKNLEKDYDTLKSNFDSLKADYDSLLSEKEKLQAEVHQLTEKLLGHDNRKDLINYGSKNIFELMPKAPIAESVSTSESSHVAVMARKQDDLTSSKSGVLDSDSSHYADGVHSAFLQTGDSSYIFECEQSNLSLHEEDNFSKNLLPLEHQYHPKIQDPNCSSFCSYPNFFGFPLDDLAFPSWPS